MLYPSPETIRSSKAWLRRLRKRKLKPLRRTTITLNRFITCIQSWRVRTAGLSLCFLLVIFLACKDDAIYIGFPKDPRLSTFYTEIPLNPTLLFSDSIATQNVPADKYKRILVGEYN